MNKSIKKFNNDLKKLQIEQIKAVWEYVKSNGAESEKITICDVYFHKYNNIIDEWSYTYKDIRILKKFKLI